jgi:hypothetical protein
MSKLTFHFQAEDSTDTASVKKEVEQALAKVPEVSTAETRAAQYRSMGPAEIIAGVTLAVGIIQESTAATEALSKLLDAVSHVVQSAKGLKAAFVDVGMRKVAIDQLTPKDLETLAKRLATP